jgi:protein involved in polysaccharide export with SLBB domain
VSATRPVSPQGATPDWLYAPVAREYVLELGDVLDLKFLYFPELNDTGVVVRLDGKISVQLIGDVVARGRTPSDLAADLAAKYGLRRTSVSVLLRKSAGVRVFVGGEVNNPGMVLYDGRLTLAQAVIQAGGPKATAELESVVVLRDPGKGGGEDPLFAAVDLNDVLKGNKDPLLQAYDVVFVPKSRVAKLNQFIEQYIVKMIPATLSAGFAYTIGRRRDE